MKKSFEIFCSKNKNLNEKRFKILIKKVLRSFQIQVNAGLTPISAFENSLINPTNTKTMKMKSNEVEVKHAVIKQKSPKINKLFLYQSEIDCWITEAISIRKIKRLLFQLHRFKVSHETIRKYVKMKFEEEKHLKKGK